MQTSLNRGSSLWITEFPGKYCPNVMSESIRCSFRGVYRRILWFNYKLYHYFLNSYTFFWKQCFADGQRGFFMQKTLKNAKNSKYVYQFRVLYGIIPLYRYLYWGFCGFACAQVKFLTECSYVLRFSIPKSWRIELHIEVDNPF